MTGQFVGDISPREAWDKLAADPQAVLVDVRTAAEWAWVGGPDLSALQRAAIQVEWQSFPSSQRNPDFAAEVAAEGAGPGNPVFLLCRSGVRSRAAAGLLAGLGYTTYNIANGFEGQIDRAGHRGGLNGWKVDGLPWTQS
jgi:rhodanese-related sulfurtransferase